MSLKVVVHSAKNLPDVDFKGKSDHDPFAVLTFRGRKKKTPAQKETLDPTWLPNDATFDWPLGSAHLTDNEKLFIKIKDYEKVWFKRLLGQVEIPLREVRITRKVDKRDYELHDGKHQPILDATISLEIEYVPPGDTTDGTVSQKQKKTKESPEDKRDDEHEDYVDERESDDDEEEASRKGKEKGSRVSEKKRIRRRLRRQWSDKTKDFQIRIQILEGRHLPGSDIHPLVRVAVAGQRQHTNAAHSTNRPTYNKMLHFNFHGSSEAELFDEPIILEVFNSRGTFRSNALLGFFKFDIGYVYERKGHCFINKWIMLSKPDGKKDDKYAVSQKMRSARSLAGYLKVSAVVLGPGDKLPVGVDATSQRDKDEDIDANCLMPVGVQRQSALFVLKVYQANDLPQMDTGVVMKFKSFFARLASWSEDKEEGVKGKDRTTQDLHEEKNLVDPYLTFSFGGKKVSTDVIYNKSAPQFNDVLRIPFMFPSMCERLKLQLMDWDQGSRHDHIGAAFLSLSSISGPGEVNGGFLPQFGPCFINFYGSPREYHQMPDKYDYLNKGIGEGVAYRGRLLVELKTMPTHSGVTQPDRISWAKEDTVRFESYKRLSNFTLFACFHEASMVAVTDRPVEFELSIGNKGTKFDESVAHSNTTPCKAIPAGFHYHYLPWGREKPCVWIESQWEDIAFRIEPLNVLNRMRESLEIELEELKVLKDDQSESMHSVFKGISKTCSDLLKYFQDVVPTLSGLRNALDNEIHNLRKIELNYLIKDSKAFYNKPESEKKKENFTAEIRNYIRRIKSMAMEPQLSMPDVILWMMSGDKRVAYHRIPAHDLLFSNNVDAYGNSENSHACGKFCGKIVELPLKYPRREGADEHLEIPALVRMELWLGLRRHQQQWINRGGDYGEFKVFAEKYENQKRKSKTEWKPSTSPNWPNYSDAAGQLKLPKDSFAEPDGWEFFGDPNVSAITTLRHPDENLTEFRDEMYEHERRKFPGGDWEPGKPGYTDTYGEERTLPIDPPTGWTVAAPGAVNGGWTVDLNRAVDEEGWEYSPHRNYVDFGPEEKAFHLSRRRRLIRLRKRTPGEQVHKDPPPTDGWEYSRSLHESFHPEEKSTDCLRRRRLLHQIVPSVERTKEGGIKFPIFKVFVQGKKGKESALCVLPRMFVTYKCVMKCQLWVSIYQARGLISQDKTGKNDPYVRVTFVSKSQETKILPQTLCPTWDQTLIFEDEDIYGNPGDLAKNPPSVVMELFDQDKGKHDFLGRCRIKPKVLVRENELPDGKLTWRKVHRGGQDGGQILVECELFLIEVVNLPARPKKRGDVYPIRNELRPVTQPKAIEILSWGVRDLKGHKSVMIPKPSVEFECNQEIIKSDEVIGDMKTRPNFRFPVLKRTILELPESDEYAPPLNILVYDNWFGKSLLGLCEIPSIKAFEVKPESQFPDEDANKRKEKDGKRKHSAKKGDKSQEDLLKDTEVFDWWSKYHASKDQKAKDRTSSSVDGGVTKTHTDKYLDREYDTLTIYPDKLENQPEFQGFNDFITTFPLRRGKTKTTKDGDTVVGKFKGAFRVINNPDEHDLVRSMEKMQLPSNDPVDCIVRVYIVRATQLQPKDADGLADPYVIASLGEKTQGQPSEHIAKTLNPIFGRMFEFKAKIPLVKDLKIQVWDYDFPTPDDLIGETEIDLEQRLLSRYHATCGLPKTYFKSGPFEWRDTLTPFQLLAKYCALTGKELIVDKGTPEIINIDKSSHFLEDETQLNPETGEPLQRLALHLLHTKFGFVPEHVETRPLYSKERPDMEQGKLEMWVDIFTEEEEELAKLDPLSIGADRTDGKQLFTIVKGALSSEEERRKEEERELLVDQVEGAKQYPVDQLVKAPIFIDPRQPIKYELRVIIWNTTDVRLDDNTITGEQMSDIFVKAWIVGSKDRKQCTSVHERSLDGNGSFNWRMVFSLEYLPIEKAVVMREKVHHFGRDVRVDTMPPLLKVQIFDKDRFSGSDFIGDRELNLSRLDRPCVHPSHCGTSKDPSTHNQFLDLFKTEKKTGWWACYNGHATKDITGKVEMTLEILDEDEAKANPVGLGQSEPNQNPTLPKPIRPAHSFLWYAHPLKTFRYIIWRNYKGFFIKVLIFCLLVLLIAFFVYSIPSYAAKRVVGA